MPFSSTSIILIHFESSAFFPPKSPVRQKVFRYESASKGDMALHTIEMFLIVVLEI